MSLELIISSKPTEVSLALLENKKLIELQHEKANESYNVGDIYFGRVKKIIPNLNAAFIDVGHEKDAFLHFTDLGVNLNSFVKHTQAALKSNQTNISNFKLEPLVVKTDPIKNYLKTGQNILVQVIKEPISNKGPKVTTEITLAGRFLVLVPFSNKISISQKLSSKEEKDRLVRLLTSIKPQNFGVIIRTVAEGKKVADLDQDLKNLLEKWRILNKLILQAEKPPKKIMGEMDKSLTILRDILNSKFSSVQVDNPDLYGGIKDYLNKISPETVKILKLHKGQKDIFQENGIHKQIKSAFGKKVMLNSGGYLIIEHTEAMHVIDVNSGNRKGNKDDDIETNALNVNLEAAEEIARVLRLRDMGGIIAIDFIDMNSKENNSTLYKFLKEKMSSDRAKHSIIPPSKFGVIEITRQRVRPQTDIITTEKCPSCGGTGEVEAVILIEEEIENALNHLINEVKVTPKYLEVHPFIEAYLKKGFISQQIKWFRKYKKWIKIESVTTLSIMDYFFLDANRNKIE